MAESYKLVMSFKDATGKVLTLSYNHAQAEPEKAQVKKVMNTIITNGSIFKTVPTEKVSAYVVKTDTTDIDITE